MQNNKIEYTIYDKKKYFEDECKPLALELLKKCYEGGIPYFFTAAIKNSEKETAYFTDGIMTGSSNIVLKTDRIKHHMMVAGGCEAKPPQEEIELDADLIYGQDDNY